MGPFTQTPFGSRRRVPAFARSAKMRKMMKRTFGEAPRRPRCAELDGNSTIIYVGISINGGYPKWLVYKIKSYKIRKSHFNGWYGVLLFQETTRWISNDFKHIIINKYGTIWVIMREKWSLVCLFFWRESTSQYYMIGENHNSWWRKIFGWAVRMWRTDGHYKYHKWSLSIQIGLNRWPLPFQADSQPSAGHMVSPLQN